MDVLAVAELEAHFERVAPHRRSYTEVAAGLRALQAAPDFLLGPLPAPLAEAMCGTFEVGPVGCMALDGVGVGVDGVMLDGSTALATLATNHPADYVAAVRARIQGRPVRAVAEEVVLLGGPGQGVFGHWLVDFLPRLHVLSRAGHDPARLRYLVAHRRPGFVDRLLAAFGIGPDQLVEYDEETEIVLPDRLLVPSNLRQGPRLHPLFRAARDALLARAGVEPAGAGRRLLITRRAADPSRTLANRAAIEDIAIAQGFERHDPSDYGIRDQLALFAGAGRIVGEYGSGLHGSMFAPDGAAVCAIRGTSFHPGFIQTELAHSLGHRIGYVLGETRWDAIDQTFSVAESHVRLALDWTGLAAESDPLPPQRSTTVPHDLWTDFATNRGRVIHKWKHYFPAYERHFGPFRDRPILFIEIGCGAGGSLGMWKRYFGPLAQIVGLDINPECKAYEEDQVAVRIGDQSDPAFLASVLAEFGTPDIVLDDGSHIMAHVEASFLTLYPCVHKTGVYAVEDLHTAYWPDFGGGLHAPSSFIERCKNLLDELNGEWTVGKEKVTPFTRTTASMHFYDSMAFFERAPLPAPRSFASGNGKVWEA